MVRKYGHGWFRESMRHSLAARGIRTNKFFAGKKRMIESLERQGLFDEARKLKEQEFSDSPPDPQSERSQRIRALAAKNTEDLIAELFKSDMSLEDKERLKEVEQDLKDLGVDLNDASDLREKMRQVQASLVMLPKDVKAREAHEVGIAVGDIDFEDSSSIDTVSLTAAERSALERKLESLEDQLENLETKGLTKKQSDLLDELAALTGRPRKAFPPGLLTAQQLKSRVGKDRAEEIVNEIELLNEADLKHQFRSMFQQSYPGGVLKEEGGFIVVDAIRQEVVEKLPGEMKVFNQQRMTIEEMRDFLSRAELQRAVAFENPLKRARGKIVVDRRDELLQRVIALYKKATERELPRDTSAGMKTATVPVGERKFTLGEEHEVGKPDKKPKVFLEGTGARGTTAEAVARLKAREEQQKANLKAAREARKWKGAAAPGQVLAEEAKESRKRKKAWKDAGAEEVPDDDFDTGDF